MGRSTVTIHGHPTQPQEVVKMVGHIELGIGSERGKSVVGLVVLILGKKSLEIIGVRMHDKQGISCQIMAHIRTLSLLIIAIRSQQIGIIHITIH